MYFVFPTKNVFSNILLFSGGQPFMPYLFALFLFHFLFCLFVFMFSSKGNGIFPSDRNGSLRRDKHNVNKYFYFYQIWRQILKRAKKRCLQTLLTCFLQTIPRRTRRGILSVPHRLIYWQ